MMLFASVMVHSVLYTGVYWSPLYGSIKEFEDALQINPTMRMFISRFNSVSGQLFFYGGFFAMYSWFDVIRTTPNKFTYFDYIFKRYIRMAIIAIPILLIYFILPQLNKGPYYSDITNHFYENWWVLRKIFLKF